ncbi:phosphodiester glycosidase family protein [Micromonospora sp. ALFpr18c]|uniref:phosphodiester glycosidase family protein n=1 Tax=unclassified Micromonospora TaxID=2617518 RepID=UPI00124B84F6|nr:phosphodiester glycosidase family protein [Micromonospora sp. ALFpr18c]KAB1941156.1 phosphodiester glycosidase family protein [Micromonospora sp. ALFpr18c]
MTVSPPGLSGLRRAGAFAAATLAAVALAVAPGARADAAGVTLPIGDSDLTQVTTSRTLADGVTLTRIVRGTDPAPADQINTTTRGPWVVNVLTIDPRRARGHLRATYGPTLGQVEKTTDLVRDSGALAGVNASFFTFTASQLYPGDPVGLGLYGGKLLSEPTAEPGEVNFVVDATTNRALTGKLTWSGSVRNRRTNAVLPLEFVNHPPVIPAACATLVDQTLCAEPGDVVQFTPEFDAATPSGAGVEVVLNQLGCVVRTATSRGTALATGQTSLQATGRDAATLLAVAGRGCLDRSSTLTDQRGRKLALRPGLFGVNGRYPLTADGQIVVPDGGSDSFFARNPRTIAGTTRDGKIVLATIDGRQVTSVGTTLDETAAVAQALGMDDAVNLDGGGSTAMAAQGALVNQPSGAERAVGDALVYVPGRYHGGS